MTSRQKYSKAGKVRENRNFCFWLQPVGHRGGRRGALPHQDRALLGPHRRGQTRQGEI